MKTFQEFVSEALMARPSLVSASLNKPQPAAVQNAQKNIVRRPVPATKPVNTNTATAAAAAGTGTTPARPTPAAATPTKRPSLMQQAQELRAMRMRSMQRQGNTAGANQVRSTLSTGTAGASDQRAQQLNRVRNQARSATIANARGGQGMMRRSPVVQQQRPAATGTTPAPRPAVQQQRPVVQQRPTVPTTPQKPKVGDKATDPEALTGIELERQIGNTGTMPTNVKPKFRERDLFTDQPLNPNTGKPIQQQPKFRERDLFTDQPLNQTTGKPIQQQQNNKGLVNVKTDAGVTTGVDPSTGEKRLIQGRSPQEQQRIKSALDIPGSTTKTPAANSSNSQLSDDMISKAFAARKATMMRGDGGEYSNMGKTPEEFRSKFNSLPTNRQRAILRRLAQ